MASTLLESPNLMPTQQIYLFCSCMLQPVNTLGYTLPIHNTNDLTFQVPTVTSVRHLKSTEDAWRE